MSPPKYLILDDDLAVVGMASSYEACLRGSKFTGSKINIYKLQSNEPEREIDGFDKLLSRIRPFESDKDGV